MITAYAVGGPRDKIKITAPASWDGKISKPIKRINEGIYEPRHFYPGIYVYQNDPRLGTPHWLWIPAPILPRRLQGKGAPKR